MTREILRKWKSKNGILRIFLDRGAFHALLFQASAQVTSACFAQGRPWQERKSVNFLSRHDIERVANS